MMSDIKKEKTGEIELDFVVTKTKAGFFGKHAAEICTANNTKMYNKPYHYHINMIHGGKVVGNIMLYMFNEEEEEEEENPEFADYVIARGFNPTNEFIRKTNPQELVKNIIEVLKDIATKNDRQAIYVPVQDEYRSLSNRDLISKELAKIAQQSRQENTSLPNQLETELNVNEDNTTEPLQLFKKTI
jgi:hypothetical protein